MLKEYLSNIANAFRTLLGTTDKINAQDFEDKVNEVYEAGKKAEWSEFWDAFQNNGEAVSYAYVFYNIHWTDENFNPKYDLLSTSFYWAFRGSRITDTKKDLILSSNAADALAYAFNGMPNLKTIRKLRVFEETQYSNTFIGCSALENITFEGIIGQNISFKYSPLTQDSLMSVIEHLKDFTGTEETRTLTLGTTNLAKLTDEEKAIATQKGWTLA